MRKRLKSNGKRCNLILQSFNMVDGNLQHLFNSKPGKSMCLIGKTAKTEGVS